MPEEKKAPAVLSPLDAGERTSEGRLTIATIAVSLLVALLAGVTSLLQAYQAANPEAGWVGAVLAVAGLAAAALGATSYNKHRSGLKQTTLSAGVAAAVPALLEALTKSFQPKPTSATSAPPPPVYVDPTTAPTPALGTPTVYPPKT